MLFQMLTCFGGSEVRVREQTGWLYSGGGSGGFRYPPRLETLSYFPAEVEIYLTLDHPHIAALRDVYETAGAPSHIVD